MQSTTTANPIPTMATLAREAARRLLDGLQALVPSVPLSEVHRVVRRAATAHRRATVRQPPA